MEQLDTGNIGIGNTSTLATLNNDGGKGVTLAGRYRIIRQLGKDGRLER